MGCGMSMVKYILFIFNLLCALCGIALLAVGIGYLLKYEEIMDKFEEANVRVAPILFIIFGSIIFLIAFFGCCGAIRESHCMISTYASILFLILVIQIVIGVIVFMNVDRIQEIFRRQMNDLWRERDTNKPFWSFIQRELHCCGLNEPGNWGLIYPSECCPQDVVACSPISNHYRNGCLPTMKALVGEASTIFGSIALVVAGIQLVGFIFACCLANNIRNRSRRYA